MSQFTPRKSQCTHIAREHLSGSPLSELKLPWSEQSRLCRSTQAGSGVASAHFCHCLPSNSTAFTSASATIFVFHYHVFDNILISKYNAKKYGPYEEAKKKNP